jgi:hypothetical protein
MIHGRGRTVRDKVKVLTANYPIKTPGKTTIKRKAELFNCPRGIAKIG